MNTYMRVAKRMTSVGRAFSIGLVIGLFGMYLTLLVLADSATIDPEFDGTVTATPITCGGGGNYDCINDGVASTSVPTTGTDYLDFALNDVDFYLMQTVDDVDTVSQIRVNLYHIETSANIGFRVALYAANETTQYGANVNFANQTTAGWDTATFSGLSLTETQLEGLRVQLTCYRISGGGTNECRAFSMYADVVYQPLIEVTVGTTTDNQQNLDKGATSAHVGGAFTITENVSTRNITSVTIREAGSVDASTGLKDVKLLYDLDTTGADGYNCSDQSYDGNETQFGATSTNGFSAANGSITFSDSVVISTTSTMCLYTVLDVASTTSAGQSIEIEIANPSTDVVGTASADVEPVSTVSLPGTTFIQAQDRNQTHYHWRHDDGNENDPGGATSATEGVDDTPYATLAKLMPTRLRLQVSNEGNKTSDASQYRLEYGRNISYCGNVVNDSSWIDVGAGGGDWDMFDSSHFIDASNTTDIAESIGGMPNDNTFFLTPNAGIKDISSQTGNITLTSTEFVELEYSIEATNNATEGYNYCFRLTDAGSELETYTVYPEATILADINVSAAGTQRATVDIPTANVETGAHFVLKDNITGVTTIESITITASGTVDLQNDIEDIELWYDLDTTGGDNYNCSDQSYGGAGGETQFGATDTDGFSLNGTSTFTGSVAISTTSTMCLYVIYTATSTTADGTTLDIKIQNAATDVVIDSGDVAPAALVDLSGTTQFVTDITTQVHYHWRNDDGGQATATAATTSEDAILENLHRTVPTRLRIGIANEGSSTTPPYQYRLEYALKVSTCEAAAGWTDVGAVDDEFNMYDSPNLIDGSDTTNISIAVGGVSDVGDTFFANNNAVKDTSSQTDSIALPGKNFTDLEYALVASTTATEGATYCFRVTNAGAEIGYDVYPEVSINPRTDFFIQRGVTTVSGTGATITAGADYTAPSASSSAFIRIVGTHNTGAGSPTNSGSADDTTVYVSNPDNITSSITFTRPATAADSTRVAWEIIEYVGGPGGANEIIVREQATITYGSASTAATTTAIANIVDDADMAVFITGQGNPDTGTGYPLGLSTAAWNSAADTVTFTRGASGNAAVVSFAAVEFTGDNWKVQRAEHTYTSAANTETETISAVNSLSRAFLHTQKRLGSGLNNHSDFGHNVYLSGLGQVSFKLENNASTPSSHVSVAWVIENIQDVGDTMVVSRSNSSESAGTAPKTIVVNIGATISDTQDASLFINNYGNEAGGGGQNSFPEPIYSAQLISRTQYELWVGDPGNDTRTSRAEVVEWPTAARDITQNYYYFFVNNDALDPTDPWPEGIADIGEITAVTENDSPVALGEEFRVRMTLQISSASMEPGIDAFDLQYRELVTTCDAVGGSGWSTVGNIGSTTALWRGTTTSQTDGTALSIDPPAVGDLNISVANVAGTFEEQNPSAFTPYVVDPGEDVEFDWVVQHNGAKEKTSYCFRMVESDGTLLEDYIYYPIMHTAGFTPVLSRWRFYDDETNLTPTSPLAAENVAPSSVEFDNIMKLRTTVIETTGGEGADAKFKLQYSLNSDFSTGVFDVVATSTCAAEATSTANFWCYDDGAGIDNAIIDAAVLSDADACSGGTGAGCGTHNEGATTTTATFDQTPYAVTEYEFTLRHDGARANAVYYFRLYDLVNDAPVAASTTYPSLQADGAKLTFTVDGVPSETSTEGIMTDFATTPTVVNFNSILMDTEYEVAQRITIDTNATEGYQVLLYGSQALTNSYGATIDPVATTNDSPGPWTGTACLASADGCFGYHPGDDSLANGSIRFSSFDTYAALEETPREIFYSSVPIVDVHDIVYKVEVGSAQPAGAYNTDLSYLVIPLF